MAGGRWQVGKEAHCEVLVSRLVCRVQGYSSCTDYLGTQRSTEAPEGESKAFCRPHDPCWPASPSLVVGDAERRRHADTQRLRLGASFAPTLRASCPAWASRSATIHPTPPSLPFSYYVLHLLNPHSFYPKIAYDSLRSAVCLFLLLLLALQGAKCAIFVVSIEVSRHNESSSVLPRGWGQLCTPPARRDIICLCLRHLHRLSNPPTVPEQLRVWSLSSTQVPRSRGCDRVHAQACPACLTRPALQHTPPPPQISDGPTQDGFTHERAAMLTVHLLTSIVDRNRALLPPCTKTRVRKGCCRTCTKYIRR